MLHLPHPLVDVLIRRGVHDPEEFLRTPILADTPDPIALPGISEATARILMTISNSDPSRHPQESRGLESRPLSQDRERALYGACDRSHRRIRPQWTSRNFRSPLRRPDARPGDVCFELGFAEGPHLDPFYFRNDYVGLEQWSRTIERGHYVHLSGLHEQHKQFAKQWDHNLRLQGFAEAFERQQTPRA